MIRLCSRNTFRASLHTSRSLFSKASALKPPIFIRPSTSLHKHQLQVHRSNCSRKLCSKVWTSSGSSTAIVVTPTSLKKTIQELTERLDNVKMVTDPESLKKAVSELESKTTASDFWDDRQQAESVVSDLNSRKEDLRKISEMETKLEEVALGFELLTETEIKEEDMTSFQDEILNTVSKLEKMFNEWDLLKLLSGPYDTCDAYLSIQSGAGGTEAQDWAEMLERMYKRWAQVT